MIGRLTGTIATENKNPIIIDVAGVGYRVFVPGQTLADLPYGSKKTLVIHTSVKDDAIDLFGFATEQELTMFELLLAVPGIGPKTALLVIGHGVAQITAAILNADVDFFTTIPRLGKKNAQKIIIELKTKIGSNTDIDLTGITGSETKDIMDALLSMGFDRKEVLTAVKTIGSEDRTTEQKLKHALMLLGKNGKRL